MFIKIKMLQFLLTKDFTVGWVSSVGIATGYGMDITGLEFRWGTRFSGPGAHPASSRTGTRSVSREKSGQGVALTTYPHLALRLKK